jgi:MFS family permease
MSGAGAAIVHWTARQKGTAVGLIVLANFLQSISVGINAVIFTVALEGYGLSTSWIGVILAIEYLSVFGISFYLPGLMRWMSLRGALEVSTLFRLPALLALGYLVEAPSWAIWVFIHGIGNFLFGILLQTWINSIPFERTRGLNMGLFGTSISLGLALGPVLLGLSGHFAGFFELLTTQLDAVMLQWFGWTRPSEVRVVVVHGLLLSALLSTLAVLPIMLGRFLIPKFQISRNGRLLDVVRLAPAIMLAVMLCGFCILGLQSFITVYGLRSGLSMLDASYLMTAFMLGSILLEMPIASASDWFDRRYVMITLVLLSLVAAMYLPMAIYYRWTAWALLFVWGGMMGGLFSICLALMAERFQGEALIRANGAFALMDNVGGLAGVLVMGIGMDIFGEDGFPYAIMLASVAYFSFALTRYQVR